MFTEYVVYFNFEHITTLLTNKANSSQKERPYSILRYWGDVQRASSYHFQIIWYVQLSEWNQFITNYLAAHHLVLKNLLLVFNDHTTSSSRKLADDMYMSKRICFFLLRRICFTASSNCHVMTEKWPPDSFFQLSIACRTIHCGVSNSNYSYPRW